MFDDNKDAELKEKLNSENLSSENTIDSEMEASAVAEEVHVEMDEALLASDSEHAFAEVTEEISETIEAVDVELDNTELAAFESAEIEEKEFIEDERLESIIESYLFATDRPVTLASIKNLFIGTQITNDKIRKTLDRLAVEYAGARRGIVLEEISSGYQLRTKIDNLDFLKRSLKARIFKLSGPALEVLSIVAYKQPMIKNEIDQIRGVESGHLLRALMEKGLINFEGKSDLPGKPMQYATTRKFLEIFGLRNLKELPSLSQIDELLPEGIGDDENDLGKLSEVTTAMGENYQGNFSVGEEELLKIESQLSEISTTSEFFEEEKRKKIEAKKSSRLGLAAVSTDQTSDTSILVEADSNDVSVDEALAAASSLEGQEEESKFEPEASV